MRLILLSILFFFAFLPESNALDQWEQRADFGNFGRHRGAGMGIGNKVYCGMGHLNGVGFDTWYPDWWEYDPATNAWTQKADYIGNNGNGDESIATVGMDFVGYAGMGQNDPTNFYKYDPVSNQWSQVTSPPAGTFHHTNPFRIGNMAYFPTLSSSNFYKYDPSSDTWTQLGNLPFSTIYGIPTFSINNKGYIKNGANFYEYDPVTDNWTPKATFPGLYPNRPKAIGLNNYGYVIGGFQGNPLTLPWEWCREVWRYDPSTDTWVQMNDFPGSIRRWAVIMKTDYHIYYGLGTNGTNFNDFWEFNENVGLEELQPTDKTLIKVTDFMGRETEPVEGTPLIYIYSDGTIERKFILKE